MLTDTTLGLVLAALDDVTLDVARRVSRAWCSAAQAEQAHRRVIQHARGSTLPSLSLCIPVPFCMHTHMHPLTR